MSIVYNLNMIDTESSSDEHIEVFNIGFFSSREKAEITAKRYLTNVNGFKDYNVAYLLYMHSPVHAKISKGSSYSER